MSISETSRPAGPAGEQEAQLKAGALGLPSIVMQGVSHTAPAVGMVLSLQFITSFAGVNTPLAYLIAFAIVLTLGISLTQLAKHLPSAGGYYTYVSRTVHPRAGWLTAWMYFLYDPTVAAINLAFMGFFWEVTMTAYFPDGPLAWSYDWWIFFLAAGALVSVLAYVGVQLSVRAVVILGALEVAIVAALAIFGVFDSGPGGVNLDGFIPGNLPPEGNLFLGVVFAIFAFTGFESVAPLAEETEDPRRTLPRGIVYSILIMGVFFVLAAWAIQIGWGTASLDTLVGSEENPVFELARDLWGGAWVIVFLAVINSILAVSIACNNAATRVIFAMARSGALPAALAKVNPRFQTPWNAVTLQVVLMFAFGLGLGFWLGPDREFFLWGIVITLGMVLVYTAGNLGVFLFYRRERRAEFNWLLHLVLPAVSTIALLIVAYKTVNPLPPEAPEKYAPLPVVVWLLIGIAVLLWMRSRGKEDWLLRAGEVAYGSDADQDVTPGGGDRR